MKKKILFVYINRFSEYPILYEYCVGLRSKGYEIFYLGLTDIKEEFLSIEGVNVIHIDKRDINFYFDFAKIVKTFSRRIQPDVIHVFHFRWCFMIPLIGWYFTKYILDVRTVHVANSIGKHSYFTPLKNFITWVEGQFYPHTIALTIDVKKILIPTYKKIPIIPLGANLSKFNPPDKRRIRMTIRNELKVGDSQIVFLYSGTLSPIRRIDVILYSFAELSKKNKNCFLIIAGDDKDNPQTINNLKELSQGLCLASKVYFTGFLPYDKLIGFYLAADVGICYIPQKKFYDLQPPTKLFEYMAASLIVVATRTTANMEVIRNNENGLLCNDDVYALCECISKIADHYDFISKELRLKAYKRAEDYSWEKIIDSYLCPYYNSILNDKSFS